MDEKDYNKKFESLTEGMKFEKLYDDLADRAEIVRRVAMHCGAVYWTARKAGLPRKVAAGMARDYFAYETGFVMSGGDEG